MRQRSKFSNEFDLLVDACMISRNLATPDSLPRHKRFSDKTLSSTISVDTLLHHAVHHKVVDTALAALPSIIGSTSGIDLSAFRKKAAMDRLFRMDMARRWIALVQALESAGVKTLTIKGPALSMQLYGQPCTREYTDIDLLIDISSLEQAKAVLGKLGFFLEEEEETEDFSNNPIFQSSHHLVFWRNDASFRIEVHAKGRLGERTAYHEQIFDLFERSERLEWEGKEFHTLSRVDHGVFALAHGTQHEWCTLHWLLDAAMLMKPGSGEFCHRLLEGIQANGMEREAKIASLLLKDVCGFEVDTIFIDLDTGPFKPDLPVEHCLRKIESLQVPTIIDAYKKILRYDIPLARDLGTKLKRFFAPWKIPVADAKRQHLPKPLYFLHFFLRPFNVIGRRLTGFRFRRLEIISIWVELVLADLRLKLLPYEKNKSFIFTSPNPVRHPLIQEPHVSSTDLAEIEHLKNCVAKAARYRFFFNLTCLRRSIVLRSRLAKAGIESNIVFGARRQPDGSTISGHAWLRIGDMDIDSYGNPMPIHEFSNGSEKAKH